MGTSVVSIGAHGVTLASPLEPNLNHRGTAFGGSVATLAILAGWTHLHFKLRGEGFETHTVIHESSVHFDKPISGDFVARCGNIDAQSWERFTRTLARKGKARIRVDAVVESGSTQTCSFRGSYVAVLR